MCGIIAYSGFRDSKEVLLTGLEKIQYRGYDSMGLLVAGPQGFNRVRSKGGLQQLKNNLKKKPHKNWSGVCGMAHSRWATHGAPTEKNAHPHKAGSFYIVHNGLIENSSALKAQIAHIQTQNLKKNRDLKLNFLSDTDSEVVAHTLWHSYHHLPMQALDSKHKKSTVLSGSAQSKSQQKDRDTIDQSTQQLKRAIFQTVSQLKGEYAIVLMSEEHPGEMWAFKKGPSLLLGMGEKEVFVCSDVQGILPYTNKVLFLQDGEVAHIQNLHLSSFSPPSLSPSSLDHNPIRIHIYSSNGKKVKRPFVQLDLALEVAERGDWPCYMLKEIHEQPACVQRLIHTWTDSKGLRFPAQDQNGVLDLKKRYKNQRLSKKTQKVSSLFPSLFLDQVLKAGRLNIVACGSSYYSALFGKYVIEQQSRVFVSADRASEFRYRSPVLYTQTPILLISQSGETADTLAVLKMIKKQAHPVLSLCNVPHSSLDRGAEQTLYMLAGLEKAVASTKAFTSTLTTLFLLALCLAKHKGLLLKKAENKWLKDLKALPDHIRTLLSLDQEYKTATQHLKALKNFIYVGRDIYYPLAQEGALKIKELSYRHASAYPAGELKHGPLALVDENIAIVGIAPQSSIYSKTHTNLEEIRCRGGKLIIIGTKGDQKMRAMADVFLPLPVVDEYLSAILCAVPLQLMAYHTACALGHNVDQPRNLAKSVTVE